MRIIYSIANEILRRFRKYIPWLSNEKRFSFHPVDPKKLYRSAQPDEQALSSFINKYGLRSIIVLTEHYDRWEKEIVESMGLIFVHIPIKTETPPSDVQVNTFLAFLADSNNLPALVHCIQGRDRTGCLCFLYRVEQMGWDPKTAWDEMRSFGFQSLPKHARTHRAIKEWLERRYGIKNFNIVNLKPQL